MSIVSLFFIRSPFGPRAKFKMSSKIDDYKVIETLDNGKFGLRQKISRISDGRLFEWREINYKSMDDALKEVIFCVSFSVSSIVCVLKYDFMIVDRW